MSCFLPAGSPPGPNPQTVSAEDPGVQYHGKWSTKHDSQQHPYQVSATAGDTATFSFEGTSIQVFGEIDSHVKALFGIDSPNGGATCDNSQPQKNLLYDSSSLSPGLHTLLITNQGGTFTLNSFEVFGGSETGASRSTSQTPIASPSPTVTPTNIPFPSLSGSSLCTSNSAPPGTGTSLPSTLLTLPLPHPSVIPPGTSLSRTASDSAATSSPDHGGAPSYTTSSYTEVTVVGGSTTTIVIQTIVEVRQTQAYRGPSRGAVAGAAVGSLLFLFLLIGLGLWWWRRRRNRVRFLYGISNLDFGTFPAYSLHEYNESVENDATYHRSCHDDPLRVRRGAPEPGIRGARQQRDSNATLYGDTLPPYKWPVSYSSLASEMKKHPPSECATSGVAGDGRNTRRPSEERSLFDSHCSVRRIGLESAESAVVPPSEEHHEVLQAPNKDG